MAQVHSTPVRVDSEGYTVTIIVGAGGAGIYYGSSSDPATLASSGTFAAAGSTFLLTGPAWVVSAVAGQSADLQLITASTQPSAGSAGPYGLAIGKGGAVVPIGVTSGLFGNFVSNGTDTSASYRVFVPLADSAAPSVLPVFANQPNIVLAGEFAPPNPITIAAAVELSDGTVIPFKFNGQHTVTISGGDLAIPDYPVAFGAQLADAGIIGTTLKGVYIRTYVQVAASRADSVTTTSGSPTVTDASITAADQGRLVTGTGIPSNSFVGTVTAGTSFLLSSRPDSQVNVNATASGTVTATIKSVWPLNYGGYANGNKQNATNGADVTTEGSAAGSAGFGGFNASAYGPVAVLGLSPKTRKPIVASITDSIFYGTTDNGLGPVARACGALGLPHIKLSKVGETAASYITPAGRKYRMSLISGATHAVIELGTNDGVDTTPKATTLQTNLTTLINFLTGLGIKVLVTTVPPKGLSSTDGYATAAGQTQYNSAAGLAQINSWIRGLPLGISGYIEMNDPLSTARDSGLWASAPSARHLTDLATTSGTNTVTSASANFTSADVGLGLFVTGVYTNSLAIIGTVVNATTVTVTNGVGGAALNAGSTVSGAVGGVGAWYATGDGTHPSTPMMTGVILTNVQAALAGLSL